MNETSTEVHIPCAGVSLEGRWESPAGAAGIVVFAHGSGSSRWSPRHQKVAAGLRAAGFATLLFDLLTAEEDRERGARFEIDRLTGRLLVATRWIEAHPEAGDLPIGYFGASTGAAAALRAAAAHSGRIAAVVSRGGRPDLATNALPEVLAPTLLIVGGEDRDVLKLNRAAALRLRCSYRLVVVEGATHLFEEPGALDQVERLTLDWFDRHLRNGRHPQPNHLGARALAGADSHRMS